MSWDKYLTDYKNYIKHEKNLSDNTVEAYMRDLRKLRDFSVRHELIDARQVRMEHIEELLAELYDTNVNRSSQARILSGIRSFFNYLLINDVIDSLPTEMIDSPKISRKLPDVLSEEDIVSIIEGFDLSQEHGHRNRAIIETLYSCGLRVSELINITISDLFLDDGYMRVTGKGDKQRLVPMSRKSIRAIENYLAKRMSMRVDGKHKQFVFLNNRGRKLSRVMVFLIVKDATAAVGITKNVSPHTFRHSFATHSIQGGADIRVVQEMLGHESILTTEIYTHLNKEYLHRSIDENHPLAKMDE